MITVLLVALAVGGVSVAGYYVYDRSRKKTEATEMRIIVDKIVEK
jgi:hypothetical protein